MRFRVPLGFTGHRTLAGMIWFNIESNGVVVTPSIFLIETNSTVSAQFYPSGGLSNAVCWAQGGKRVTVLPVADGISVSVYDDPTSVQASRVWEITNDGGAPDRIRIVKRAGVNVEKDQLYVRLQDEWVCVDGFTGACESVAREGDLRTDGWQRVTRLLCDGIGGPILSGTLRFRELIGTGVLAVARETLNAEWDGVAQTWRETTMTYWDAPDSSALNGLPKLRSRPHDGFWEYRAYDSEGRETLRAVPLDGSAAPDCVSAALPASLAGFSGQAGISARVTVSAYDGAQNGSHLDKRRPRKVESYVVIGGGQAVKVSCEWHTYTRFFHVDGCTALRHRVVRASTPSSAVDDAANPWSETVSYADERSDSSVVPPPLLLAGRPLSEENAAGGVASLATWAYDYVDTDSDGVKDVLRVTSRQGTPALPDGLAYVSTYEVETLDALFGRLLRRETRLHTGGAENPDPVLSWEERGYDAKGRLLQTLYSDGTLSSNVWGCCRLEASVGRDGAVTTFGGAPYGGWSVTFEKSLGALPGAGGGYPATLTQPDALGRETNSVRYVCLPDGSADPAHEPLATRTAYPYGTGHCAVTTDPLGVQTVEWLYYEEGCEIRETVAGGVTTRVTRVQGGMTVTERFWDGGWTRETRSASYGPDGCRAETAVTESSDCPAVTNSVTVFDFLGRESCVLTPAFGGGWLAASNVYDGASSRVVRSTRTGSSDTLHTYDALGGLRDTALDADGDGVIGYDGADRVSRTGTACRQISGDWWRETASAVWPEAGSAASLTVSVTRVRLTGLGGAAPAGLGLPPGAALTAQTVTLDWRGNATVSSEYTDPGDSAVWRVAVSPVSVWPEIRKTVAGRQTLAVSPTCVTNTFGYDGFARQATLTDGRGNTSVTAYNALGQVAYTEDAASSRTSYAYDALGRLASATAALSNTVHTAYDSLGNVAARWGATYPVEYGYDARDRKISMKTFRVENGNGDETLWLYDNLTGLLTNKVYADGSRVVYAYTADGRLASRTWARGVTAAYAYDAFGQVTNTAYSDGTPAVSRAYDRLGRTVSAVSDVSSCRYTYRGMDPLHDVQDGAALTRVFDGRGLPAAVCLVESYIDENYGWWYYVAHEFGVFYNHDDAGRLWGVETMFGLLNEWWDPPPLWFSNGYGYRPGSDQVAWVDGDGSPYSGDGYRYAPPLFRAFSHDPARGLVSCVSNLWGGAPVSSFAYAHDAAGRRTQRVDTTTGLPVTNAFGYNPRSEVTEAVMGDDTYGYAYDPIGNRTQLAAAAGSGAACTNAYAANALNQYTCITNFASFAPSRETLPAYDADGNLTAYGPWAYTWDAENRLVSACSNGVLLVTNVYDHRSRRVRKEVSVWDGQVEAYVPQSSAHYLWDGWNVVRETVAVGSGSTQSVATNYYTWGLDLSGTLQGAGGVGGLLAVLRNGTPYFPCYDANCNVTGYVATNGASVARYEYSPFGETTAKTGSMADDFTHRFSTKPFDAETGLAMYQLRPYEPVLGRWLCRDPIGEEGGANLYGVIGNNSVNGIDPLGLKQLSMTFDFTNPSEYNWLRRNIYEPWNKNFVRETAEIIRKIKSAINPKTCDCIKVLNLSAHGSGAGNIVLGDNWYMSSQNYLLEKDDTSLGERQLAIKRQMEQMVAFLSTLGTYLCKNSRVTFVICGAGEGDEGSALRNQLVRIFPAGTKVVLFSGSCGFVYGIPTAQNGDPGKTGR